MDKIILELSEDDIQEIIGCIDVWLDWCFENKYSRQSAFLDVKMRKRITDQINFDWVKPYEIPKRILKKINIEQREG
jgi:hypothetical protein